MRLILVCLVVSFTGWASAQQPAASGEKKPESPAFVTSPNTSTSTPANEGAPPSKQQPKRILGVMPNYRAVSAGAIPPPPTPKQAFKIATQNSFDYSSFAFVGITSAIAEGTDAHPQLGKGMAGSGDITGADSWTRRTGITW